MREPTSIFGSPNSSTLKNVNGEPIHQTNQFRYTNKCKGRRMHRIDNISFYRKPQIHSTDYLSSSLAVVGGGGLAMKYILVKGGMRYANINRFPIWEGSIFLKQI